MPEMHPVICDECGDTFLAVSDRAELCSPRCRQRRRRDKRADALATFLLEYGSTTIDYGSALALGDGDAACRLADDANALVSAAVAAGLFDAETATGFVLPTPALVTK